MCGWGVTWSGLAFRKFSDSAGKGHCRQVGPTWVTVMVKMRDDRGLSKHKRCNRLMSHSFRVWEGMKTLGDGHPGLEGGREV